MEPPREQLLNHRILNLQTHMMRKLLCIATILCTLAEPLRAQTIPCRAADDLSSHIRQNIVRAVTGSDSTARTAFKLPSVSPADVTFMTSDSLCTAAAQALFAAIGATGEAAVPVWLLQVGTNRYVVFDGIHAVDGREEQVVFDGNFTYLVTISG